MNRCLTEGRKAVTYLEDSTAPVTTDDVPGSVQGGPVAVTLAAADAGGAGVDKTYYTTGVATAHHVVQRPQLRSLRHGHPVPPNITHAPTLG